GIPDIHQQITAAFDWWREAGVDNDFIDDPKNWIASAEPAGTAPGQAAVPAQPQFVPPIIAEPAASTIDTSSMPANLPGFVDWWLSEPSLDAGCRSGRRPRRGGNGAELMVIVPRPEAEDSDMLLSGPQGRLLDAILQAMGIASTAAYVTSALP